MVIINEELVKLDDQRDKSYSFATNSNEQLKYFTAVYSIQNKHFVVGLGKIWTNSVILDFI